MRHACRWALAAASALIPLVPAAQGADGIKASATASRDVPADIVVASFQLVERSPPAEGAADQQAILAKAIEEKGLKLLERSTRYQPGALGSYSGGPLNVISGAGGTPDFVTVTKQVGLRVSGFRRIDDLLGVLALHGVRQQVTLTADHSKAQNVLQELEKEAIERAIAHARSLAAHAGVRISGIADISAQPGTTALGAPGLLPQTYLTILQGKAAPDQALIAPPQPNELPRLRFSVTATVVLGIKAD